MKGPSKWGCKFRNVRRCYTVCTDVPDNSKGPPWALRAWRRHACLIPSQPGIDILIFAGNIVSWLWTKRGVGWRRRPHNPEAGRGGRGATREPHEKLGGDEWQRLGHGPMGQYRDVREKIGGRGPPVGDGGKDDGYIGKNSGYGQMCNGGGGNCQEGKP